MDAMAMTQGGNDQDLKSVTKIRLTDDQGVVVHSRCVSEPLSVECERKRDE